MSKKRRKTRVEDTQPQGAEQPAGDAPQLRLHTADELDPQTDNAAAATAEHEPMPADSGPETIEAEGERLTESEPRPESDDASQPEPEAHSSGVASAKPEARDTLEQTEQADEAADPEGEAETTSTDATTGPLTEGEINIQQVVEAILFSTETPLTPQKIVSVLGVGSVRDVKAQITALNERYEREGAAFRIEQIAGGYQMLSMPQFNTWIRRLRQARQESRFSAAALETLAVVAYKQPVVRAEIEAIRGVSAGEMLNRLRELGLVKIVGRAEDVGRPMLYGTTKRFLELFGLASLEDLPSVEQLQPPK